MESRRTSERSRLSGGYREQSRVNVGRTRFRSRSWRRRRLTGFNYFVRWMKRPFVIVLFWTSLLASCSVLIPLLFVQHSGNVLEHDPLSMPEGGQYTSSETSQVVDVPVMVPIYMSKQKEIEQLPLESYIRGVVAAEMPIEFELEALKAQAIAARTYIIRRIVDEDFSHVPVADAWVTDTVQHQAFISVDEMRKKWGWFNFTSNWKKITQAVEETKGLIMTYDGRPIEASYFSTSNGYTENSEDYWSLETAYLRSVPSPWDEHISPKYKQVITFSPADVAAKLGVDRQAVTSSFQIIQRTASHRVKEVSVGGKVFTGREIREKLGLASSHFEIRVQTDGIQITTYGYGHGVGMSQYGAQGMALEGKTVEEILKHYYQGIEVEHIVNLPLGKYASNRESLLF